MSANNYILIQQTKENTFEISNRDADTGYTAKVYKTNTLEEAVKKAHDLENECWTGSAEYGIKIKLLDEK